MIFSDVCIEIHVNNLISPERIQRTLSETLQAARATQTRLLLLCVFYPSLLGRQTWNGSLPNSGNDRDPRVFCYSATFFQILLQHYNVLFAVCCRNTMFWLLSVPEIQCCVGHVLQKYNVVFAVCFRNTILCLLCVAEIQSCVCRVLQKYNVLFAVCCRNTMFCLLCVAMFCLLSVA